MGEWGLKSTVLSTEDEKPSPRWESNPQPFVVPTDLRDSIRKRVAHTRKRLRSLFGLTLFWKKGYTKRMLYRVELRRLRGVVLAKKAYIPSEEARTQGCV